MKIFKDLQFLQHPMSKVANTLPLSMRRKYTNLKQATLEFENGYGVSVIFGEAFFSNGINTYELAVLKDGNLRYDTWITDDVMRYLTEGEVTAAMIKVQELK